LYAPETRMNRRGDLCTMNKRDHFVESSDERGGFLPGNVGGIMPSYFETDFQGKRFLFRSQLQAQASEAIRAVGMALPPTLRVASVISR
jgi:hypothetical protein